MAGKQLFSKFVIKGGGKTFTEQSTILIFRQKPIRLIVVNAAVIETYTVKKSLEKKKPKSPFLDTKRFASNLFISFENQYKTKLDKLNAGNYDGFQKYGLIIFSAIPALDLNKEDWFRIPLEDITRKYERHSLVHCINNGSSFCPCCTKHKPLPFDFKVEYSGPMTKTMNDGSKATIIRIISANAVDVQFEDGFVLKHARLTQFNKGTLKGHHTNTNV